MKQKAPRFTSREQVLMEEFELIHQALFTDPDDQSGWFYHLWLLDQTIAPDAPFLVSSWPSDGSELLVSSNTCVEGCKPFRLAYNAPHRIFPVVLYFNQVVKGVNATTVTVESIFSKNDELIWQPLSTNNSAEARSWVTYLKIPDVTCNSPRIYSVKVNLGHSQGLVSSTGFPFSHTYRFGFTLDVSSHGSECTGSDYDVKTVDWDDGNFYCSPSLLQNGLPNTPFEQLRITKDCEPLASKWHIESLSNEINLFQELISEMDCKIAKLTVARLLIARDVIMSREILPTEKRTHFVETLQLYDDLMKLDPSHIGYYKDQRSLVLLDQITSDKESLAKHCWHHKELASKSVSHSICVRFDRLSLTRIGSIERILWVSMLDLSHNELQSIEGLEAMQLLSYLNLSNNKISSITALEPLRMIKSLKILDISYNEIGTHSIDTTRYLCASPLSHKFGSIGSVGEFEHYGNGKIDYWEAMLIFKDLHLTQLSVVGNPALNESFSLLLVKLIPSLERFDGRHIWQV
uniref:Geranylgeranyl transferase type-2 subunit alpha n=1 Tax=Anthurium amnicola TaxID=1678845 RepID=A0A1D1XQU3_9ARAE